MIFLWRIIKQLPMEKWSPCRIIRQLPIERQSLVRNRQKNTTKVCNLRKFANFPGDFLHVTIFPFWCFSLDILCKYVDLCVLCRPSKAALMVLFQLLVMLSRDWRSCRKQSTQDTFGFHWDTVAGLTRRFWIRLKKTFIWKYLTLTTEHHSMCL